MCSELVGDGRQCSKSAIFVIDSDDGDGRSREGAIYEFVFVE